MAVTSMANSSIANGQERYNRVSGVNSNLDWCGISTTATGNYADSDGLSWDYWIFKANSSLVVSKAGLADYLVVAGGGTGVGENTRNNVGAGGAGGVIESPVFAQLNAGTYAVTIGSGGAATTVAGISGNDGSNSSLGSLAIAIGGGGGGGRGSNGNDGGCGGGSGDFYTGSDNQRGGDGTFGQGFRGGTRGSEGGAGGGAGAVGTDGLAADATVVGGVGRTTTIITTTIATAQSVGEVSGGVLYFAGGGGAGNSSAGGLGGGGAGSPVSERGVDCLPNTGGGSGNSDVEEGSPYAGAGGSGVVIVRTRV
jgi:hypothetical protein